jgi:hypothetical protein
LNFLLYRSWVVEQGTIEWAILATLKNGENGAFVAVIYFR